MVGRRVGESGRKLLGVRQKKKGNGCGYNDGGMELRWWRDGDKMVERGCEIRDSR